MMLMDVVGYFVLSECMSHVPPPEFYLCGVEIYRPILDLVKWNPGRTPKGIITHCLASWGLLVD